MMTKEVKADLPDVKVLMPDNEIYPATTAGRLNEFATVTLKYYGATIQFETNWKQIAERVTTKQPINYI